MGYLEDIDLGIGTAAWGKSLMWQYGKSHTEQDIRETYQIVAQNQNVMLDTAELYGFGESEKYIGQFASDFGKRPIIATKFFPYPWRWTKGVLLSALRNSLHRLNISQVDLYQMHWALPPIGIKSWMQMLAHAAAEGLTRDVGVSNYNKQQTQLAYTELARYGVKLAANQVKYTHSLTPKWPFYQLFLLAILAE
jgi:aryl-alcohol dehydrogenase-like predicted oxidoreductase